MLNVELCMLLIFLYFVCHKEMLYKACIFVFMVLYMLFMCFLCTPYVLITVLYICIVIC
jgi:hypothetical protein